jgi:hypothetical protein
MGQLKGITGTVVIVDKEVLSPSRRAQNGTGVPILLLLFICITVLESLFLPALTRQAGFRRISRAGGARLPYAAFVSAEIRQQCHSIGIRDDHAQKNGCGTKMGDGGQPPGRTQRQADDQQRL